MEKENGDMESKQPIIIYEDGDVLVVDKPEGWLVHSDGKSDTPTIVEWFLGRAPEARGVGEAAKLRDGTPVNRSGVVHRLDRETSGVLILAKNQEAHKFLKAQFKDRNVRKEYRAFVYGRMHDRWGTINRPIGRSQKDSRLRSAMPGAKGQMRDAITDFERIASGEYKGEVFTYVKLIPKTGRTHQLRAHLRAIERPIVGDGLYADYKIKDSNNLGLNRLALHAHQLELITPDGEERRFIAPVPREFDAAAESISTE